MTSSRPPAELSPPVLVILGPTGVGKSSFAMKLARNFDGEIISCDSMAVYRGLDIGTDKPSSADRLEIPHHLIDVAEPGTYFSAGAFRHKALETIRSVYHRGRLSIIVGGTGLYARALLEGMIPAPPRNAGLRKRLDELEKKKGPGHLHALLRRLDPDSAGRLPAADTLRLIRALEVRISTGKPLSQLIREQPFGKRGLRNILKLGLTAERRLLYNRVEARVDRMLESGFHDEVRALLLKGVLRGPCSRAIGYAELSGFLQGEYSYEEAVHRIKQRTRQLAKRQLTWFRREMDITWYRVDRPGWQEAAREQVKSWIDEAEKNES